MADIQGKLFEKYGIDINKTNLIKLYKLDSADITSAELEVKLEERRRKWEQTVNGPNEKFAERDRKHLENADVYESILRDGKLRKELFGYYKNDSKKSSDSGNVDFAKEYFSLIRSTKKIRKDDVEFFFEYYPEQRKNKKAILTMLTKEMKVVGIGKESAYSDEKLNEDENESRNNSSVLIENLFRKETILKLKKCEGFYEKAQESVDVRKRYPQVLGSMYDFIEIDKVTDLAAFTSIVADKREAVYNDKQEYGAEYAPLVDMYNTLSDILKNKDVIDNYSEFKLLTKYPKLSPYMYEMGDMKPDAMKKMFEVANSSYRFHDINDFILTYFEPIYDNFNIRVSDIKSMMKKAQSKAAKNKILNEVDKKLGRDGKKKYPIGVEIIHWMLYWPTVIMYFIFEVLRLFFAAMEKSFIPVFIVALILCNLLLFKMDVDYSIRDLLYIFNHNKWLEYIYEYSDFLEIKGHFFIVLFYSIAAIGRCFIISVLPAFLVADIFYESASEVNKHVDWIGIKRTYKYIADMLKQKTYSQYETLGKGFYKTKILKIIINVISTAVLILLIAILVQLLEPRQYGSIYKDGYTPPR